MCASAAASAAAQKKEPIRPADAAKDAPWLSLPPTPDLPEPARSGLAAINGTNIFFAEFGKGQPVLLLHGGLANSNYWGHQVAELAKNCSVVTMDTRGHGRSPLTSQSMKYQLFAEDAVALLDMLNIPAAAVVGWSDGAIAGLQLAMWKPERISRLFAFGANYSLGGFKANGSKSAVFASYAERCRLEYGKFSPHPEKWPLLVSGLRAMWSTEPNFGIEKLAKIKVPMVVSDGEYDEIIKRDHTEELARAISGAHLALLKGVSHFAMLQDPTQFNKALVEFMAT